MKSIKIFFLSVLVCSLAFPNSIFANIPIYTEKEMELIVSEYNKSSSTLKEMIQKMGTFDIQKAKELENFMRREGVDLSAIAPNLIYQNKILTLESYGKKLILEFSEKDSIQVSYANKSVLINSKMTPDNIKIELTKLFNMKVSSSFLDLIISKANAELVVVTIIILAAAAAFLLTAVVAIMDSIFWSRRMNKSANEIHELCNRLENSTPSELALTKDVLESYNSIASTYGFRCANSETLSSPCKHVKEARDCLRKNIQKAIGSNDSGRSSKKIEYNETKDEYHNAVSK